nr:uncharacterized protein LOC109186382 [Ipomoea batatas]
MPAGRKAMGSLTIVTLAALTSTSSARLSVTHRSHHHPLQIIFPSVHSQTEVFSCDVCKSLGQDATQFLQATQQTTRFMSKARVADGECLQRCVNEVVFRLNGAGFSDSVGREQGEQGVVRGGDAAAAMSVRRCCFCSTATRSRMPDDQGCRRRTCCRDKERWQTWAGFPVSLLSLILCWRRWRRDLEWQAALLALHRGGTAEARLGSSVTSLDDSGDGG